MKNAKTTFVTILLVILSFNFVKAGTPGSDKSSQIDGTTVKRITRIVGKCYIDCINEVNTEDNMVILFKVGDDSILEIVNVTGNNQILADKMEEKLNSCSIKVSKKVNKELIYSLPLKLYCKQAL